MPSDILGSNFKKYRNNLDLKQQEVADYLGIAREEVSYYENGQRVIPTKIVSAFASLVGIAEYDLYQEDQTQSSLNLAFAFRADQLCNEDLTAIAKFKKIVTNYAKMKKLQSSE